MPRVRPHFKIHTSIQNHRRTIGLYEDDALLAMYVRAGLMAIERFADRTGDSFLCSGLDLERIAGCRGVANARRKLGRLEASSRLAVGQEGAGYRLTIPNLARKQGFGDRNGAGTGDSPTPTAKETPSTPHKSPAPVVAVAPWALSLSSLLIELLQPVPGARIPKGAERRWAKEIEALQREAPELDWTKDPIPIIEAGLRWALSDENLGREYEVVIRSGRSLREKWPKLVAASARARRPNAPQKSYADLQQENLNEWFRESVDDITGRADQDQRAAAGARNRLP